MWILSILVILALVALVVYFVVYDREETDASTLVAGSQSGMTKTVLPYELKSSFNQPEGLTYSYAMWILVKDFSYGYGQQRTILSKGDAPGVYLDSTSNSLLVRVKTYGTTEAILIPNIPARKWVHLALVVNQNSVDIYINGILRQHHTLSQLPDLTEDKLQVGDGWNGVVGNISYYPRSLSYAEVSTMSKEAPPPDMEPKIASPNYFDITWYTGRLNSK